MAARRIAGEDVPMADDRPLMISATLVPNDGVPTGASSGLTRAEFDALATELHDLRDTYQRELAEQLRDARSSGSPGDNEEILAVHEEVSVTAARIVRLEELLRSAPIVEREFDGCVSVGCTVRVAGDKGRTAEYTLIGRRSERSAPNEVSSGSPVGRALLGARPGQLVRVKLPDGSDRVLRILDVTPGSLATRTPTLEDAAEAA
jgi:transcription elongation factor GreA